MRHMTQENLGIHTCRQISSSSWQHILATNGITDDCYVSNRTRERGYLFPLYLYPDTDKKDLFSHTKESEKKQPNISPELFAALSEVYQKEPTPEEIFYYIYAVLYSNIYRTKYAEFLKIDFPKISFTKDYELFSKMAEYGERLVDLHLLKSTELDSPVAKFQGKGDDKVEKLRYDERNPPSPPFPKGGDKRVYINQSQYFEGVAREVWQYQIGGYQVCDKWLKDRKGKPLSLDEMKQYCRIVTSLQRTIEIQKEIDNIYPEVERL